MALGIYIALVVITILGIILFKVIQNTSKTSYFGEPNRCKKCGRKSEAHECPFCQSGSKSLR